MGEHSVPAEPSQALLAKQGQFNAPDGVQIGTKQVLGIVRRRPRFLQRSVTFRLELE
jgi:hypothetical protein